MKIVTNVGFILGAVCAVASMIFVPHDPVVWITIGGAMGAVAWE